MVLERTRIVTGAGGILLGLASIIYGIRDNPVYPTRPPEVVRLNQLRDEFTDLTVVDLLDDQRTPQYRKDYKELKELEVSPAVVDYQGSKQDADHRESINFLLFFCGLPVTTVGAISLFGLRKEYNVRQQKPVATGPV